MSGQLDLLYLHRFCNKNFHLLSTASPHPNLAGKPCLKLKVYVKPTSEYFPSMHLTCLNSLTIYVIYIPDPVILLNPYQEFRIPILRLDLTRLVNHGNSGTPVLTPAVLNLCLATSFPLLWTSSRDKDSLFYRAKGFMGPIVHDTRSGAEIALPLGGICCRKLFISHRPDHNQKTLTCN